MSPLARTIGFGHVVRTCIRLGWRATNDRDGSARFGLGGYAGTAFMVDRANDRVAALHMQVENEFSIDLWDELLSAIHN